MTKVILKGFDIAKLFDVITIQSKDFYKLFPKNNEIRKILENNNYNYYNISDNKNYNFYILLETEEKYTIEEDISFIVEHGDVFEINFETEEDAFYFKLKYC